MIRVLHVITDLMPGGAQAMLAKLIRASDGGFAHHVVSLSPIGTPHVDPGGASLRSLEMASLRHLPRGVTRLAKWLRADMPDVMQTWMYHADLIGAAVGGRAVPVAWNIRQASVDRRNDPWTPPTRTVRVARVCATISKSSRVPAAIVTCSRTAARNHERFGYAGDRIVVIPNGFETNTFRPDPAARAKLRAELGISETTTLVGYAGRYDDQKGYSTLLSAFRLVHHPRTEFLLCGPGVERTNSALAGQLVVHGVDDRCHVLGHRTDMPAIVAALDVAVSASLAEGMPNFIGEAMSAGIPCVASDVGDTADLIGETGWMVPAGDERALADALNCAIDLPAEQRGGLGVAARKRIEQEFAINRVVCRYEELYRRLADGSRNPADV